MLIDISAKDIYRFDLVHVSKSNILGCAKKTKLSIEINLSRSSFNLQAYLNGWCLDWIKRMQYLILHQSILQYVSACVLECIYVSARKILWITTVNNNIRYDVRKACHQNYIHLYRIFVCFGISCAGLLS